MGRFFTHVKGKGKQGIFLKLQEHSIVQHGIFKLFYYAARVQQVKLKGKNATHWEHHKEP
jgi:hypothetical protein